MKPTPRPVQAVLSLKEVWSVKTESSAVERAGDLVVIHEHRVGESRRVGEILEVLGEPGHRHYRVRWDDDRETIFYPSNDAVIQPARKA
jgi:hypothetical protein